MRVLVLSPHADDAVWSLGGWLSRLTRRGHAVTVVTVFDGDPAPTPPAAEPWRQMMLTATRRQEDARALARLGVAGRGLGLADAALRQHAQGGFLYHAPTALFSPLPDDLAAMTALLTHRLRSLPGWDILVAPRGCGGHVDHLAVRAAALALAPTHWYGEFPYADDRPPPVPAMLQEEAADWPAWREAGCLYRSQTRRLFGTLAAFTDALGRHAGVGSDGSGARLFLHRTTSAA